jgi:hypothetical protein
MERTHVRYDEVHGEDITCLRSQFRVLLAAWRQFTRVAEGGRAMGGE